MRSCLCHAQSINRALCLHQKSNFSGHSPNVGFWLCLYLCVWVCLKISRIKWVVIMFSLKWQSYLEIYMWCLILTTDLTNPVMYKILKIPPGWSPAFPCRFPCVVAPQRPMRSSAWGTSGMKSGSSPLCRLTCTHEAGKAMAFQQGTNYKWVK